MTQFINTQRGSKGEPWERGLPWASINSAAFDGNDIVYWLTDWSSVRLVDWKTELTWPQWEPWKPWKDWEPWQDWAAATISVGTTTTGNPWTNASVTNSGTSSAAVFNFTIPRWADGTNWQDWADGQDWAAATITAWTATWLPAGSSPTVTNSGSSSAAVFNFWIPAWATWATGNGISSVTTSKSWKVTTVTMNYTDWSTPTSFQVSDGQDWEWSWDVIWPNSSTNGNVALFDWVTGKLIKDSWKAFTAAGIWALPDSTKYWKTIDLSVDTTTYVVTATLKDQDWTTLSSDTIDLPLESVVVSGSYDAVNKKVVLTLENGSTVEFSVADLVAGLQTEITSTNKLDADLVDDSTSTNKFVTAANKTTWNWKQDALIAWANIQIAADWKTISATDTTYSAASSSTSWLVKLWSDTVQSVAANAVSWTASRTYAMQVNSSWQLVVNIPWTDTTYTASDFDIKNLADSTGLRTTWSNKQDALSSQTAYTSKGTSTKVPTITTNTLGQVTWITETSIAFPTAPVSSVNTKTWAVVLNADDISDSTTTNKFVTASDKTTWSWKQDALVSWTNIKTVKGTSLLGSGNIAINEVPSSWTTWYVLTKTSSWYWWAAPAGWDVMVSTQTWNVLQSWMKIWAGTESNYSNLGTYDDQTVYLTF